MINLSFDLSKICTRSSPDLSIPDSDRPSLMQMPIHPFTAVIIEAAYYSQQVTTILKSPARAQANPDPASDCYITRVGNLPPLLIRSRRDQIQPDQQQIVSNLCSLYTRKNQKNSIFNFPGPDPQQILATTVPFLAKGIFFLCNILALFQQLQLGNFGICHNRLHRDNQTIFPNGLDSLEMSCFFKSQEPSKTAHWPEVHKT